MFRGTPCPKGDKTHQHLPTPWWSGKSLYQEHLLIGAPEGVKFFHEVFKENQNPEAYELQVGDLLLPPADRRLLSKRAGTLTECNCIPYITYDLHAVYITACDFEEFYKNRSEQSYFFQVEPIGPLWRDPERINSKSYCCSSAKIVKIFANNINVPPIKKAS